MRFEEIRNVIQNAEDSETIHLPKELVKSLLQAYERYEKFYSLAESMLPDSEFDPIADEWVLWEEEQSIE